MNGWNSTNKALGVKWDWPLEISPKMTGGICFLNLFEPYRTVGGAWDIGVAHGTQENHLHYCTETPSNPRMPNTTLGCLVDIFFFCVCFFSTTFFFGGNTTKCNMLFITYTTCFFHIINIMNHEYILMHTIPQSINARCSAVAMRLFFTGRIHHTYQSSFCWWFVTNG